MADHHWPHAGLVGVRAGGDCRAAVPLHRRAGVDVVVRVGAVARRAAGHHVRADGLDVRDPDRLPVGNRAR